MAPGGVALALLVGLVACGVCLEVILLLARQLRATAETPTAATASAAVQQTTAPVAPAPPPAAVATPMTFVIDIGAGVFQYAGMGSGRGTTVISFDPFGELVQSTGSGGVAIERHRLIVALVDTGVVFTFNREEPGCSSLNALNTEFTHSPHFRAMSMTSTDRSRACAGAGLYAQGTCDGMHDILRPCTRPTFSETQTLPSTTLSGFLNSRPEIKHVRHLKIDAQGSDHAILSDALANVRHEVHYERITVECQMLSHAAPLYLENSNRGMPVANDCNQIQATVLRRYPAAQFRTELNNVFAAEYNLVITPEVWCGDLPCGSSAHSTAAGSQDEPTNVAVPIATNVAPMPVPVPQSGAASGPSWQTGVTLCFVVAVCATALIARPSGVSIEDIAELLCGCCAEPDDEVTVDGSRAGSSTSVDWRTFNAADRPSEAPKNQRRLRAGHSADIEGDI